MNLLNPINKTVGIAVALFAIGGVAFTTIYQERSSVTKSSVTSESVNNPVADNYIATTSKQNSIRNNTTTVTKISYVQKCTGDDDDYVCNSVPVKTTVTVPVTPESTPSGVGITTPPATTPKQYTSVYKNGTYSATGSYNSPGGKDQVMLTLTLANDIITTVSVTFTGDRTSQKYQSRFASGYQQYVIGKNISDVNLTVVSGSSLTPIGFNNAIVQIMAQAKV